MERIAAAGIEVGFESLAGIVTEVVATDGGRRVAPLHRAPWIGEALPEGIAPHLARLAGDFFCAPFGGHEEGSPLHGWPANAAWEVVAREPGRLVAVLERTVRGARVTKHLSVEDGHPFLYQRHVFEGGAGEVGVANHAMVALPSGGLIRASAKSAWATGATAPEPDPARGRSRLAYPATAASLARVPTAVGGTADLGTYPWGEAHEEFVAGVEAPGHALGWTAVTRPVEGDLFLSLRDARALPMTMLWHSNGGRDYAPWSGRHRGCLGVEEGAAASALGPGAALAPGQPGALALGGTVEVRHAVGAIAWPSGEPVAEVALDGDALVVRGEGGARRVVPVRSAHLG